MKLYKSLTVCALSFIGLFGLVSCEKSAGELDYGYDNLYIPQSLLTGSNLNYMVPAGLDSASRNYVLDKTTNKVNIILGVLKSGTSVPQAYTVDLKSRPDTVTTILASNAIANGVMLSENAFTIPAKIEVASGQTGKTFFLSVDAAMLKANYAGKKAIAAFDITNPTKYSLNQKNNKVVVIIDVNALKLP